MERRRGVKVDIGTGPVGRHKRNDQSLGIRRKITTIL